MGTCLSQTSHRHALHELRVRCTSHARWSPPPLLYPAQGSIHVTFTLLPTNFGAQNSWQHFLISCNVPHTALPCAERAPSLVHMPCAGAPTPALAPGARVRTKTLLVVKLVLTMSLSGFLWIFLAHAGVIPRRNTRNNCFDRSPDCFDRELARSQDKHCNIFGYILVYPYT